jgi:hypothetical protein
MERGTRIVVDSVRGHGKPFTQKNKQFLQCHDSISLCRLDILRFATADISIPTAFLFIV